MEPIVDLSMHDIKIHLTYHKFIFPACSTYSSSSRGFQTYGPLGVIIKNKIIAEWRKLFITNSNNVYEIDSPIMLSSELLTNSGHIAKFNDPVITILDPISGEKTDLRADHLIKNYFDEHNIVPTQQLDTLTIDEMLEYVHKYKMVSNYESATISYKNLMLSVSNYMYLRPEIAQGIFTEFDTFNENVADLPFGLAQVGKSYRNEISPEPFTRLKEFTQAEVEYFFDPMEPHSHLNYNEIKDIVIPLLPQDSQLGDNIIKYITIEYAVTNNIITNQILAYYLATIYTFVKNLGFPDSVLKFRQQLDSELAHYAIQCWDLEILLPNGWIECVGCAYRGDYDLKVHNTKGQHFIKKYIKKVNKLKMFLNISKLKNKDIIKPFYAEYGNKTFLTQEEALSQNKFTDLVDAIDFKNVVEMENLNIIPHVIEPSIGIDRIFYAMAHTLLKGRLCDPGRVVFKLPISLRPYDIAIYALTSADSLVTYVKTDLAFVNKLFSVHYDYSGATIGRKYTRSDSIGVRLTITVDFQTLSDDTFTLRFSDTGAQIRIHKNVVDTELPKYLSV
jgi:glycyl-tRNA synthetase